MENLEKNFYDLKKIIDKLYYINKDKILYDLIIKDFSKLILENKKKNKNKKDKKNIKSKKEIKNILNKKANKYHVNRANLEEDKIISEVIDEVIGNQ